MRIYDCPTCGRVSVTDDRADERELLIACGGECPSCHRRTYACLSCGQLQDHVGLCAACADRDRAPQGEPMRLFAPAPNQLPGQLNL